MKHVLTRLNARDMAVILALFEGATLLVMGVFLAVVPSAGPVLEGAVIGLLGTPLALGIWHALRQTVRGRWGTKPFAITHIDMLPASLANAAFLITLFLIESKLPAAPTLQPALVALLGFVATALSLAILFFLYNHQPFKLGVTLRTRTRVQRIAPRAAVLAGVYEAFILPPMVWLLTLPLPVLVQYPLAGLLSGLVGGFVGTLAYNHLAPWLMPWIDL